MERNLTGIIPQQVEALIDKPESVPVAAVKGRCRNQCNLIDNLLQFRLAQI